MNILHIDSCALGDNSTSRQSTAAAVALLTATNERATVSYRDLAASPLSHASGPLLQVISQRWDAAIPMNAALRAEALQSASLLQEFQDADVVVIGAPMHNFALPSTLKAWMDRLLEMHCATTAEWRSDMRVVVMTSGCVDLDQPAMEELVNNHAMQLNSAFKSMGIPRVDVIRSALEMDMYAEA